MSEWSVSTIQADFDAIARADQRQGWNHNNHYHAYLLQQMPRPCHHALEIGCGTGEFSRRLAQRANHVLALDLSPEMIRVAAEQSRHRSMLEYQVGDILAYPLPGNHFDFISSIAIFHHLPLAILLTRLQAALKPGGVLAVLDLYRAETIGDHLTNLAAVPVHQTLQRLKNGRAHRLSSAAQTAWAQHDQQDQFLPLAEIRRICANRLPGAKVKRHLLWRYSLVWRKPTGTA
jgi:SAM-dependent methyltransferase